MGWAMVKVDVAKFKQRDFSGKPYQEKTTGTIKWTNPHRFLADLWFFNPEVGCKKLKDFSVGERQLIWKEIQSC